MAKLILGFTGEMGSGKGTAASYVCEKYSASSHRFSTPLRDILNRMHIEQSRENMQSLSTTLRQVFGQDLLAKTIFHDTEKDQSEVVVIDGVRRLDDIAYLQELPHFKLIYIETSIENRYERISQRHENADDFGKNFTEFKKEQEQECEIQIRGLKEYAAFVLDNNGTLAELKNKIDGIIESCKA